MKQSLVTLTAIMLLLSACGTTPSGPPSTTQTTSPSTTSSGVQLNTTRTTAPTVTTTIAPAPAATNSVFVVHGVNPGDVLNVRERPDASSRVVGSIPPDSSVQTTGMATPDVPGPGWWEVVLSDGSTGWVNRRFVTVANRYGSPIGQAECASPGATDTTTPASMGEGDADYILALSYESGAACDRLVVLLGARAGSGTDWPEHAADALPSGITVRGEGNTAVVAFPSSIDSVRPTATEASFDDADAFVVRPALSAGSIEPRGPEVRLSFDHNVTVGASFLSNPARIVVDIHPAPTGTGLGYGLRIGGGTVLEHPGQIDLNGPGVSLPITVTGYGRPFEAQGVAELRLVGDGEGSGQPVEATFSGPSGTVSGTSYHYTTTDWTSMWGTFEFTIDDLAPGTYELFVGEYSAKDGSPIGLYDDLTVAG